MNILVTVLGFLVYLREVDFREVGRVERWLYSSYFDCGLGFFFLNKFFFNLLFRFVYLLCLFVILLKIRILWVKIDYFFRLRFFLLFILIWYLKFRIFWLLIF